MTSYTIPYERGRAVALAAIMVLSVVAMSTAFAGAAAADVTSADRTIEDPVLGPGESTTVTVDVELDDGEDPAVFEEFDPAFAEVEITDMTDPVSAFPGTKDDEAFAVWDGAYDEVSLEYEVTVPEDAEDGDVFAFSGEAEDANTDEFAIGGDDTITVTDAEQTDLEFAVDGQSDAVTLEQDETVDYTAEAVFDDDNTADVTDDVDVTAIDGDTDAVSIDTTSNTVTASEAGTVTLEADDGQFADQVEVTVEPEPDQVDLAFAVDGEDEQVTISSGETVGYTAEAILEDGSTEDVTGDVDVTIHSGDGDVSIDTASAEITGEVQGTVTLEATHGEFTDQVEVTVEPPEQTGLLLEVDGQSDGVSIGDGETVDYTALATFADDSTEDVSTDVDVTTVSGDGAVSIDTTAAELTGETPGTVTLEATDGQFSDQLTLTVDYTVATYAGEDGTVDTDGLRDAVDDWRAGNIELDLLRDVIDDWRSS